MKGIILAGGTGSRLFPLTKITNKHLLPVGRYPMIYHNVIKLVRAGITEILIVTGKEHMGNVVNLLGSGADFGVQFTYRVQDQAGGIAEALALAKNFVGEDLCVVLLGDNIFLEDLTQHIKRFEEVGRGAQILLCRVEDPNRYGVAELNGDRIIGIEEKPKDPKSPYAVTGIYMYDNRVFDIALKLEPSARGELEITDVNNQYISWNDLRYAILESEWTDAGTHPSLVYANRLTADIVYPEIEAMNKKS